MTDSMLFATLEFPLKLRGWFPWPVALVLAFVACALVLALHIRESKRVPLFVRLTLAGLRCFTLAFILFLLLRPTWVEQTTSARARPIAVLIDNSQSMLNKDARTNVADRFRVAVAYDLVAPDGPIPTDTVTLPSSLPEKPSRLELAKKALENPRLNLVEQLRGKGPVEVASFGSKRSALDPRAANWLDKLDGKDDQTALVDGLFDLLNRDDSELPAAVVLVTDGRENASGKSLAELARRCGELKVPLHIYGVGSSAFGQLQIRDVQTQENLFVDDSSMIPVRFRAKGFEAGAKVEFNVKLNGKEVISKSIDLKEGDDIRETLSFVPAKGDAIAGKQDLVTSVKVRVPRAGGSEEVFTDELAKSVRIVDRKVKVLMVDSQPRWDFKFIQRGLMRDRRVQAKFILTEGDPRAMRSESEEHPFLAAFPESRQKLAEYDLLILGDVPATSFTREQQESIRDFVSEGGGMIHIAGKGNGPSSWLGTALADILPVELDKATFVTDSGKRTEGFRPVVSPHGSRSLLMSLEDNAEDNKRLWTTLPELYWHYPVKKLKPASEVYLVHPTAKTTDDKPMPLLATHYYGKGFVLYSGIDETWRWRYNTAEQLFGRFWTQAVYLAGVPRTLGTKLTQLSLDTAEPTFGKTAQVYARLYSQDLKPLVTDRIGARVERIDVDADDKDRSFPVELKSLPGQPGEYVATIPFNRLGRFALKVENATETAALEYRVNLPPGHELAPGGLAEGEMQELAAKTGDEGNPGRFYREEQLHTLVRNVQPKDGPPLMQRNEIVLWGWPALILLIAAFSLEWFIRKFNSLS